VKKGGKNSWGGKKSGGWCLKRQEKVFKEGRTAAVEFKKEFQKGGKRKTTRGKRNGRGKRAEKPAREKKRKLGMVTEKPRIMGKKNTTVVGIEKRGPWGKKSGPKGNLLEASAG